MKHRRSNMTRSLGNRPLEKEVQFPTQMRNVKKYVHQMVIRRREVVMYHVHDVVRGCTRQAKFRASIDGVMTTATCNAQGADPSERCQGCCQARALAAGLTTIDSAGFPSNNGRECICCFFNSCR
ncbi:hypothetical protein Y032_0007g3314 [Ancylostoma ceylanicum]|uniref:Uncharacterized protein n=1 Tax=Ancylostoma ceylanicum TaxID=53326 RepID=A0A016VLZ7_9BILA|nr:hypothetical protein Y032_0007g3314 [Ancylostoma ceylanicum]